MKGKKNQLFREMSGTVYVWVQNVKETLTWMLISKRLLLCWSRDVALLVARYLCDKRYIFHPFFSDCMELSWRNADEVIAAVRTHKFTYVLSDDSRIREVSDVLTFVFAKRLVANLLLTEKDCAIFVLAPTWGGPSKFRDGVLDLLSYSPVSASYSADDNGGLREDWFAPTGNRLYCAYTHEAFEGREPFASSILVTLDSSIYLVLTPSTPKVDKIIAFGGTDKGVNGVLTIIHRNGVSKFKVVQPK
jgi:hypothetical protein